jgi:hypothetical protein
MKPPLGVLQRLRSTPRPRPGERCEMCAEQIADAHEHVVNVEHRRLMCTCRGCWMLFTAEGAGAGRYRAVSDRYAAVENFTLSGAVWDSFQIPVSVAFFFRNSTLDRVSGFYPSPAGATESLHGFDGWDALVAANPILRTLEADVEALLVRVERGQLPLAFVVPIDACYELVGQMRLLWQGFDGGREARDALDEFFDRVRWRCG